MSKIRWLHLSDFHVGLDNYGQRQLFKYLLDHIHERVDNGQAPDLIFISGDIANKGRSIEYEDFYTNFFWPLLEILPDAAQDRIFTVPGNHDVDRTQPLLVPSDGILVRDPELLDPTDQGRDKRQIILSRINAFIENDPTCADGHWLSGSEGTLRRILQIGGVKIGILGINTAWLSFTNEDRNKLSAGKGLVEDGLEFINDCDYKIVLGHHPIDWFLDTEIEATRSLFSRNNVLYLHGHMHKGRSRYEEAAGYSYLSIQSGACFQERESEQWVNRFLWCELDTTSRELRMEPFQWTKDGQEWVIDGTAFPSRYFQEGSWFLSLPSSTTAPVSKTHRFQKTGDLEIPLGWAVVDTQYLNERNVELTSEQILSFFDGRSPIWREALAPQIPRREIVHNVRETIERSNREEGIFVTLLTGAAGEGKTTALLQVVCDLRSRHADLHILWRYEHEQERAPFPAEFIARLPANERWLIVSDDAEVIGRRIYDSIQNLKLTGRNLNLHFLLCCRDTDWKAANLNNVNWNHYAKFTVHSLHGMSETDARKVVIAWDSLGKSGLKTLNGLSIGEAVTRLLEAAKSEGLIQGEGSFFGAILQVRWGDELKTRIFTLIEKLGKQAIGEKRTLRDAFAYIAVMHAKNIQILSKIVLASVLDISPGDLKRRVLTPLGEEAAIATTEQFVFTRHQAIATIAVQILSDDFSVDIDELYVELAKSAYQASLLGTFIPNFREWQYLSKYFSEIGEHNLGIRLAKTFCELEPDNPYFIVNLAKLYRDAGQPEQSVRTFLSVPEDFNADRGFYFEWGTSEGSLDNHALSVWLSACSLADEISKQPVDNTRAKMSLAGLGIALSQLYENFNNPVFQVACGASAQLGLRLNLDPRTKSIIESNRSKSAEVKDVPLEKGIELITAGVIAAWEQREDDLPDWVLPADQLSFSSLSRLIRGTIR